MSTLDRDWFKDDEGMRFPVTQAHIERENRAQHVVQIDVGGDGIPTGSEHCRFCGKAGTRLREPCALPIRILGIPLLGTAK